VIKFFNQTYLATPWLATEKERQKREKRRHFYENSYEIAYRNFGDGILFLHLHPTNHPLPLLTVKDKASGISEIDLKNTPFVLQKKGVPIFEGLKAALKRGELQQEVDRFIQLIQQRIDRGIADGDSDVEHNWGYLDGRLFHMDPGRLYQDEKLKDPERLKAEWDSATRGLYVFLDSLRSTDLKDVTGE
jgi:hypothetical protein